MKLPNFHEGATKKKKRERKPEIEIIDIEEEIEKEMPFYSDATDEDNKPLIQDVEKQLKSKHELAKTKSKKIKKVQNVVKKNLKMGVNTSSRTKSNLISQYLNN